MKNNLSKKQLPQLSNDMLLIQEKIIKEWKWEECFLFAKNISWANIKELEKRILEIWTKYYLFLFAKHIKWIDLDKFIDKSIIVWDSDTCLYFQTIKWITTKNLEKLSEKIISTWNIENCFLFYKKLKKIVNLDWFKKLFFNNLENISWNMLFKLSKIELEWWLDKKDIYNALIKKWEIISIYHFLEKNKEFFNYNDLEKVLLSSNNSEYIYNIFKKFKIPSNDLIENKLVSLWDYVFCYYFAKDIILTNISKMEWVLLNSNNTSSAKLYEFARDVKEANIEKIQEKLLNTFDNDWYYTYMFAKYIKNSNYEILKNKILEIWNFHIKWEMKKLKKEDQVNEKN